MSLIPRPGAILAAMLAVLAAYGAGQHSGRVRGAEAERARQAAATEALQARLDTVQEAARMQAAALERNRNAIVEKTLALEDEARRDPLAFCRRPGADSLRRLRTLFASAP